MDMTKDILLGKADALLAQARRARKRAQQVSDAVERARLIEQAGEFEQRASRLEQDAVGAKNGVFDTRPGLVGSSSSWKK